MILSDLTRAIPIETIINRRRIIRIQAERTRRQKALREETFVFLAGECLRVGEVVGEVKFG